jgi:hypothetical protein
MWNTASSNFRHSNFVRVEQRKTQPTVTHLTPPRHPRSFQPTFRTSLSYMLDKESIGQNVERDKQMARDLKIRCQARGSKQHNCRMNSGSTPSFCSCMCYSPGQGTSPLSQLRNRTTHPTCQNRVRRSVTSIATQILRANHRRVRGFPAAQVVLVGVQNDASSDGASLKLSLNPHNAAFVGSGMHRSRSRHLFTHHTPSLEQCALHLT